MSVLGVVTIGQSPRDDMVPEMLPHLRGVKVVQAGALDDLTEDELRALPTRRRSGSEVLTSRLRDGRSITFAREDILDLVQQRITELEDQVDATLLVCTGAFPPFRHRRPLVPAESLIVAGARALSTGTIGVICPLPEQIDDSTAKFAESGRTVIATAVDPYSADEADFEAAAHDLTGRAARVVVMDCMGYTEAQRAATVQATRLPVILARSLVGRLAGELVSA